MTELVIAATKVVLAALVVIGLIGGFAIILLELILDDNDPPAPDELDEEIQRLFEDHL